MRLSTSTPDADEEARDATVRSIVRALTMLSALGPDCATVTQLAGVADVPVPTAIRILKTLERCGFVRRDANGSFLHGPSAIRMAVHLDPRGAIRHAISQATRELRDTFDETAGFFMQDRNERVCVESFESGREVRWVCQVGQRMPLHLGAVGRVLIAFGLDEPRGAGTDMELVAMRSMGYATTEMESTNDSWGVAAPVYEQGVFYGALGCGIPVSRATPELRRQAIDACMRAARTASGAGWSDHLVQPTSDLRTS